MKESKNKPNNKPAAEPKAPFTVSRALSGIGGIVMAFVVASIAYSSYVVYFGTVGLIPKVLLIPQAVFAVLVLLYKFAK